MSDDEQPEYDLVMPFVTVTSVGGPHDDDAYVAGFEMGRLDMRLEIAAQIRGTIEETIRSDNRPQADLLAMRRGLSVEFTELGTPGWVYVKFTPTTEGAPE